jgi:hypothetical protein
VIDLRLRGLQKVERHLPGLVDGWIARHPDRLRLLAANVDLESTGDSGEREFAKE